MSSSKKPQPKRRVPSRAAPSSSSSSSVPSNPVAPTPTPRVRSALPSFTRIRNATARPSSGPPVDRQPASEAPAPTPSQDTDPMARAANIAARIAAQLETPPLAGMVASGSSTMLTQPNYPTSLRFPTPRLALTAGMDHARLLDLSSNFDMSGYPVRSFRRITLPTYPNQPMIAWSPNSAQTPHFAGRIRTVLPVQPLRGEHRRVDGSYGALDTNIFPHLLQSRPYLGFITRASQVNRESPWHAAYAFPSQFWRDAPNGPDAEGRLNGHMDAAWLADMQELGRRLNSEYAEWLRQLRPSERTRMEYWNSFGIGNPPVEGMFGLRLRQLAEHREWDNALDLIIEAQYYVRVRRAWMDWARTYAVDLHSLVELRQEQNRSMRWAYDECIGFWVNEASEEQVLRLIAHGIPVFIMARAPLGSPLDTEVSNSFFHGSSTEREYYDDHPSLRIPPTTTRTTEPAQIGFETPLPRQDSSLRNATPLNWLEPVTAAPIRADSLQRYLDYDDDEEPVRPLPDDINVTYRAPPPLIDAPPNRRWTTWAKDYNLEICEEDCIKQYASRRGVDQEGEGSWYYDREQMRQIFIDLDIPRNAYRPELFGFALEETTPFYAYRGNEWVIQRSSTWLYQTERVPVESRSLIGSPVNIPSQVSAQNNVNSEAGSSLIAPLIVAPRASSPDVPMNEEEDRISLGSVESVEGHMDVQRSSVDETAPPRRSIVESPRQPSTTNTRRYSSAYRRYFSAHHYSPLSSVRRDGSQDRFRARARSPRRGQRSYSWSCSSRRLGRRSYSRSRSSRSNGGRGRRLPSPFRTGSRGRRESLPSFRKGKKRPRDSSSSSSTSNSSCDSDSSYLQRRRRVKSGKARAKTRRTASPPMASTSRIPLAHRLGATRTPSPYRPSTPDPPSLRARIGGWEPLENRLGPEPSFWQRPYMPPQLPDQTTLQANDSLLDRVAAAPIEYVAPRRERTIAGPRAQPRYRPNRPRGHASGRERRRKAHVKAFHDRRRDRGEYTGEAYNSAEDTDYYEYEDI
ncbi:hypothetical protein C8F01DRAFT_1094213 [Mycena amicta]|nr:hypothetical protein C8F01DRAFT_1094213 [Mycena amicta]